MGKSTHNKSFYIITDLERGIVKHPVNLYENGIVEVPSVFTIKTSYLGKQYYDCIKDNLAKLKYKKRDLRRDFRSKDRPLYLFEVLGKIRSQQTISLPKLWKFLYKDEVERMISATLVAIVNKKISRLIGAAYRGKPRNDELLRKIGYIV